MGLTCGAMPMAFFSSPPYELKSQCTPATLRPPVLGSVIAIHCTQAGHTSAQQHWPKTSATRLVLRSGIDLGEREKHIQD